jgi:hypothetical protein
MHPALLTRSELEWLQGSKQVSPAYARQMRSRLSRKLHVFQNLELPLLIERGFNVTTGSHGVTARSRGEHIKLPTEGEIEQGPLSSLAGCQPRALEVAGSNPAGPTMGSSGPRD